MSGKLRLCALLLSLSACGEDEVILSLCQAESDALRVDQISTLENALRSAELHDAPTVKVAAPDPAEGRWVSRRVREVQVLLMQPKLESARVQRPTLTVEVFASADPRTGERWALTQEADPSALAWFDIQLTDPASTPHRDFEAAWWRFDFSELIPTDAAPQEAYVVSVAWPAGNQGAIIGYSNFDLSCQGLWGIYPASYGLPKPGGGVYTSEDGWIDVGSGGAQCSYPMLRVEVEDSFERERC